MDSFMGRSGALREKTVGGTGELELELEVGLASREMELLTGRVLAAGAGASFCHTPSFLVEDDLRKPQPSSLQGILRIGFCLNSQGLATPGGEQTFTTDLWGRIVSKTWASGIPRQAGSLSCPGQVPRSGEGTTALTAAPFGGSPASVSCSG